MTLPNAVLFPMAMMPLYIFEPRYREMLEDVLEQDRLFCVVCLNDALARGSGQFEPPHEVATVGVVRASQQNEDGTSNLVLQGIRRVRVDRIIVEEPYRRIAVTALESTVEADEETMSALRAEIMELLETRCQYDDNVPEKLMTLLQALEDIDPFADVAIYSLCGEVQLKQRLLETLDTEKRLRLFGRHLEAENLKLILRKKLQGNLDDDDILRN